MAANGGRRAARFAALGDPVRLAVVDHLALGDAAPGELGAVVGLASNHLAFHLRVLQDAGITRRVRSEGDGRRGYVRLCLEDPAVAALVSPPLGDPASRLGDVRPERVVFVCTRNSARSQLAAAAWRRVSRVPVTSAGTDPAPRVHPGAVATARRHGLRLAVRGTRPLAATAADGDLLVAVCDNAYEGLDPGAPAVRLHWSVPDPVRTGTDAAFEEAYADLARRVDRLARALDDAT